MNVCLSVRRLSKVRHKAALAFHTADNLKILIDPKYVSGSVPSGRHTDALLHGDCCSELELHTIVLEML